MAVGRVPACLHSFFTRISWRPATKANGPHNETLALIENGFHLIASLLEIKTNFSLLTNHYELGYEVR